METLLENHRTVKKEITIKGTGIHSGKMCSVTLKPAKSNTGIIVKLNRNNNTIYFKICPGNVVDWRNQIAIGSNDYKLMLVEHLLSAFHGLGITDCIIETNSYEVPGMDGSSYIFVDAIMNTGIQIQNEKYEVFKLPYPIWVVDKDRYFIILPSTEFSINCMVSFPYPSVGRQSYYSKITSDIYIKEISKARTFGFIEDHEKLKARGVCLGSSFENTLALSRERVLSAELRYKNEVARHKVLDIIGDLYLLTTPIKGQVIANKSNHELDYMAIKKLESVLNNHKPSKEEIKEQYRKFDVIMSTKIKNL